MATFIPKSLLLSAGACVAALVVLTAIWYWPTQSPNQVPSTGSGGFGAGNCPSTVCVTETDFTADYPASAPNTDYLTTPDCYPVRASYCPPGGGYIITPDCPVSYCENVTPGTSFAYELFLVVNDTISHTILSITAQSPFSVASVSPTLPYSIPPGDPPTAFTVTFTAPLTAGEYGLGADVFTS